VIGTVKTFADTARSANGADCPPHVAVSRPSA
jgi:hypothetical protein